MRRQSGLTAIGCVAFSFKVLEGSGSKLSQQLGTHEVTALLSDGNVSPTSHATSQRPSPKGSIQIPSASDMKQTVQHEAKQGLGNASSLQQQHQQDQHTADSEGTRDSTAYPGKSGVTPQNASSSPVSAGWSSRFTTQLSAAASAATAWLASNSSSHHAERPTGLGQADVFPWNTRMVDKKVCDDSCDRAVRACAAACMPPNNHAVITQAS